MQSEFKNHKEEDFVKQDLFLKNYLDDLKQNYESQNDAVLNNKDINISLYKICQYFFSRIKSISYQVQQQTEDQKQPVNSNAAYRKNSGLSQDFEIIQDGLKKQQDSYFSFFQEICPQNQNINDKIQSIWVRDYKEIKDNQAYINSVHYEFIIQTRFKENDQCLEVQRRYSEIEKLHNYLKFNSKGGLIPRMPPKSYSITDLLVWSEGSQKQRQEDLNIFFQDMIQQNHSDSEQVIEKFFSDQNYQILDKLIERLENKNKDLDLNQSWSLQLINQNCFSQDNDQLLKEMVDEKYFLQLTQNIKKVNNIQLILQNLIKFIDRDNEIKKEVQTEFERVNIYFNEKNFKTDDKLNIFFKKFESTEPYKNLQLKYNIDKLLRRIKQAKEGYQGLIENLKNKKKLIQLQNVNDNYIKNESYQKKSEQILEYQDELIKNFELQFDNFYKLLKNDYENLQKQFEQCQLQKYQFQISN